MSEHAILSPSAYGRWSKCPGSVAASSQFPDTSSPAAQWGTEAHHLLELMLLRDADGVPTLTDDGTFPIPEELKYPDYEDFDEKYDVALVAREYANKLFNEAHEAGLNPSIGVESKVYPEYYTGRDDIWGSADIIFKCDDFIEIIDLKAGQGVLVMPDSGQLKIYSLGAMAPTAKEHKGAVPWKKVKATIVQPRIPHKDGVVRTMWYTLEALELWCQNELVPAAAATDNPDAELIPGEEQCRFCKAKATCPALSKKASALAMAVFTDQTGKTFDDLTSADPDKLPMEKLVEVIEAAPMIKGWIKAVEEYAKEMLRERKPVPGYKLVRSGQRNSWSITEAEVLTELTKGKGRVTKKLLTKEVLLSAPQALKLKDLTEIQRERLQALIGKSEGSLALVPETDQRENAFPPVQFNDFSFLD